MHVLVTGGARFIASHLVDSLVTSGHRVTVVDNFDRVGLRASFPNTCSIHKAHALLRYDPATSFAGGVTRFAAWREQYATHLHETIG